MSIIDAKVKRSVSDLDRRKTISRSHMRSLSPAEKIAELVKLQERYYSMLELREKNGGRAIPDRWRKWKLSRPQD